MAQASRLISDEADGLHRQAFNTRQHFWIEGHHGFVQTNPKTKENVALPALFQQGKWSTQAVGNA